MEPWREFWEKHFNTVLLAILAVAAWAGTMHLIHTPGILPENVAWAREQTATRIGALLGLLTGYKVGEAIGRSMAEKSNKPNGDDNEKP